jgi:hypothetical protein
MKKTRYLVIHEHSNMALDEPTIATELHKHHIQFHELKDPSTDIGTIGFITTDFSADQLDSILRQIQDAGDLCGGEIQVYELGEILRVELQPP